jgi:hypothetical protein
MPGWIDRVKEILAEPEDHPESQVRALQDLLPQIENKQKQNVA